LSSSSSQEVEIGQEPVANNEELAFENSAESASVNVESDEMETLFLQNKVRIDKAAVSVIQSYRRNPGFLLSVLKHLDSMSESNFDQQKLLCLFNESGESGSRQSSEKGTIDDAEEKENLRTRIHLSTFKFMEAVSLGSETIESELLKDLVYHVNSMIYAHLISIPTKSESEGFHPAQAISVMGKTTPSVEKLVASYEGKNIQFTTMLAYDVNKLFADEVHEGHTISL
jgi:hypothetical protein